MEGDQRAVLESFGRQRVLVVGEAILDTYLEGEGERLCREAPVPIISVNRVSDCAGGAANTAVNVAAYGAEVFFLSVAGADEEGGRLRRLLDGHGVNTDALVVSPSHRTTAKTRLLAGHQLLARFDRTEARELSAESSAAIRAGLLRLFPLVDAVIVSDYSLGLFSRGLIDYLSQLKRRSEKVVVVDSRKNLARFRQLHPTLVKPNYEEAVALLALPEIRSNGRIERIMPHGESLLEITGASVVAVTLDRDGSLIFERGKPPYRTFSAKVSPTKTSGAGDTYLSTVALALAAGAGLASAAELAAAAAEVVISRDVTAACTREDLCAHITGQGKYVPDPDRLADRINDLRAEGRKIVFTNGCFDLLHSGHVILLNRAKALGDVLVVGLNSDAAVAKLKGGGRPIHKLEDRIRILSGLSSVDYIIDFDAETASDLVRRLRPEIFVKGADQRAEDLPEVPVVEASGGRVEILSLLEERSTSEIIEQIKREEMPHPTARRLPSGLPAARDSGWCHAENVLCVRLDTIGDVLMTTPAMRALKQFSPRRRLTLLTAHASRHLSNLIPEVDEVLLYDAPWMKSCPVRDNAEPDLSFLQALCERRFDAAVIFATFSQNPLPAAQLCYLAGIPLRLAHCRENPYQLLTDWVKETEPASGIRHEVERQLELVAAVGCSTKEKRLSFRVPAAARRRVVKLLAEARLNTSGRWIVLHPGASAQSRRYPARKYIEVIRVLTSEHGFEVLLTGSEQERELVEGIQHESGAGRILSLAGRLSLAELGALIESAPLLISNNTGPAHIAAAVGTPVVDLYALTNPQHTPWLVPSRVLFHDVACKNCFKSICPEGHHRCLELVTPGEVVRAALELMERSADGGELRVNA